MDYVEPAAARKMDGLRLALTAQAPAPYSLSARAILDHHGVAYVPVLQVGGGSNEDLLAWTGHRNAPVAVYNDEAPRRGLAGDPESRRAARRRTFPDPIRCR